jgi:hypothetical protein
MIETTAGRGRWYPDNKAKRKKEGERNRNKGATGMHSGLD